MPLVSVPALLSAMLLTHAPDPATADARELWAGHQITFGSREVPFKGTVTTRTDTFSLARVRRREGSIELVQTACRVLIEPVGAVEVTIEATALPRSSMRFVAAPDDGGFASDAELAWGEDDVDGDGNPGVTVRVSAPMCSGELYVSNRSTTKAVGDYTGHGFAGDARVRVVQHVIDAKGACLSVVASDTDERVRGPFAYVPVPADTTCAELLRNGWPVDAEG